MENKKELTYQEALKILQYRGYGYSNDEVKQAYETLAPLVDEAMQKHC